MNRKISLFVWAAVMISATAAASYVVSEIRASTVRSQSAIIEMDTLLRIAEKVSPTPVYDSVRDLIDVQLDVDLAILSLDESRAMLDATSERVLKNALTRLKAHWSA